MFKRDITESLRKWRKSPHRKPLIMRGARQVGKTTIVHEFGREFNHYLYYNLENPQNSRIFEQERPLDDLINFLFAHSGQPQDGETLLFIDEIQNSPKTIALLRYFYELRNDLFVIAAGSLLENVIDVNASFPVGRVQYLPVRPCSFCEFLSAINCSNLVNVMSSATDTIAIHSELMSKYNQYSLVGGMPEIVDAFSKNPDIASLNDIYETLLQTYRDDVEKYTHGKKLTDVIRFILTYGWYKAGEIIKLGNFAGSTFAAREVGEAFRLLQKAMLLELAYPTTSAQMPAIPETRRMPKLLWLDSGLVNYAAKLRKETLNALDLLDVWRGHFAEQLVGQELLTQSHDISQTRQFWSKGDGINGAEVDFVWIWDSELIPIEVKAGHNAKLRSLHSFIDRSPLDIAVRVWSQPFSIDTVETPIKRKRFRLVNLPFYLVGNLEKILTQYA